MGRVQYEDRPVTALHVHGIHLGSHVTWTRPVQWQPPSNNTVGSTGVGKTSGGENFGTPNFWGTAHAQ